MARPGRRAAPSKGPLGERDCVSGYLNCQHHNTLVPDPQVQLFRGVFRCGSRGETIFARRRRLPASFEVPDLPFDGTDLVRRLVAVGDEFPPLHLAGDVDVRTARCL